MRNRGRTPNSWQPAATLVAAPSRLRIHVPTLIGDVTLKTRNML
jgi:hypothetical protein